MRKGLVVVVAGVIAFVGFGVVPAAAELVRGGWAQPIPVPPPEPLPAEPAAQRPLAPPPPVHAPVRRRAHRREAPAERPLPDNKVRF